MHFYSNISYVRW